MITMNYSISKEQPPTSPIKFQTLNVIDKRVSLGLEIHHMCSSTTINDIPTKNNRLIK